MISIPWCTKIAVDYLFIYLFDSIIDWLVYFFIYSSIHSLGSNSFLTEQMY